MTPCLRNRTRARHALAVAVGIALAAATGAPAAAQGGDPKAGRRKAQPCVVCHGPIGISSAPDTPHVAGQPEVYFVEQMKAYRTGKRVHPAMNVVAKPLTDADIDDMAAWYASIKVSASLGTGAPGSRPDCAQPKPRPRARKPPPQSFGGDFSSSSTTWSAAKAPARRQASSLSPRKLSVRSSTLSPDATSTTMTFIHMMSVLIL